MRVSVPLSYAGELYNLRTHIAHVQESLRKTEKVLRGEGEGITASLIRMASKFHFHNGRCI